MSADTQSPIRRTFSRGIYEFFSYLLPGVLTTYLFYVSFSLSTRGTGQYISILSLSPISTISDTFTVLLLLLLAYLVGHLSWPLRMVARKICYGNTTTTDRIYSALSTYFSDNMNGEPLHEHIVEEMRDFTKISDIQKLSDLNSTEGETGSIGILDNAISGWLPISAIQIRSDRREMRRGYRIIKRFVEYNYPDLFHRGYERYQGLRRFWEVTFSVSVIFSIISIYVMYDSKQIYSGGVVLILSLAILKASLQRLEKLVLNPYREVFLLFYLHQQGKLPR